ncbi:hypothetical protein CFC21_044975 [Triticum aestivum]|uniref:NAC domain-containing protein n=2 Tax=Triticum aestivum TaxID=4565 RepID=A0A9R1JY58_WHEAT|nr:hypothetical protein CFC21_044975 [Triticum aestivum]CDM87127.1 unnamed protein product [Triticum aestivum]
MNHAPPGFRFTPTREELIRYYLDPWVADPGKTPVAESQGIICVADIYGEDPAALTSRHRRFGHDDGNWYFLCVSRWKGNRAGGRTSRTVQGGGTWHGYGKRVAVPEAGHRQAFEYLDARGRKTAWLMEEFGTVLPAATYADGVRVLCRVHQTTRTVADDDVEERGESSKAARSSKRRRRITADAKDEQKPLEMLAMEDKSEPLENVLAKDEADSWEILAMKDKAEPWEMITMDEPSPLQMLTNNLTCPQEMLTNNLTLPQEILTNNLPWPLEMLTNSLPWPLEMLTNNLTLPLEMLSKNLTLPLEMLTNNLALPLETLTKNLPEPAETVTKNLPSPLEILGKNLPKLDILTKEEPTTTTTTFDQDSGAANKEATPNAEMEMPADAEWHSHYPELFEQKEPPPMEDVMKPLPSPTVQEFEQGAPPAAVVEEFGGVAWGWGGHGRRCLVRPMSLAWILPGF